MLQIAIHGDDVLAAGMIETGCQPGSLTKLRRSLTTVTRLSTAAISRSMAKVWSAEPSSTSTISKVSPCASITTFRRS